MNIQRGRDHSIATYSEARDACGMSTLSDNFDDNERPTEVPLTFWNKLRNLYESPKDIELFTAGMAERPVPGGIVGPTFACIIANQFKRLKYYDRYINNLKFAYAK